MNREEEVPKSREKERINEGGAMLRHVGGEGLGEMRFTNRWIFVHSLPL